MAGSPQPVDGNTAVSVRIGPLLTVLGVLIGAAVWATRLSLVQDAMRDDIATIKADLRAVMSHQQAPAIAPSVPVSPASTRPPAIAPPATQQ